MGMSKGSEGDDVLVSRWSNWVAGGGPRVEVEQV